MAITSEAKHLNKLDAFKTSERYKYFEQYKNGIDYSKEGLKASSAFATYERTKPQSFSVFNALKAPDGVEFAKKFTLEKEKTPKTTPTEEKEKTPETTSTEEKEKTPETKSNKNEAIRKVQAKITGILSIPGPEDQAHTLVQAKTNFNNDFDHIKQLIEEAEEKNETPPRVEAIASYLAIVKGEMKAAVTKQHEQEIQELEKLFEDKDDKNKAFVKDLATCLGLDLLKNGDVNPAQLEQVKQDMIASLKEAQNKAWQNSEKELNDSINRMQEHVRNEFDRISYLAQAYDRDEQMRAAIDKLAAKNKNDTSTELMVNCDTGKVNLKGVNITDLDLIKTVTGRTISKNADGSFSMQLNRLFQTEKSQLKDLTSLAQTVKACGHKGITLSLQATDSKKVDELGRKAFEAAVLAGFDPKDITINVNGTMKYGYDSKDKKDVNELFKEASRRHQSLVEHAKKINQDIEGLLSSEKLETKRDIEDFKGKMQAMREANPQKQEQEQEQLQAENQSLSPTATI